MCGICEQYGINIHNLGEGDGGGGPLAAPTESFTIAQAAAHLNRDGSSWNDLQLGTGTNVTYSFRNTNVGATSGEANFTRFSATQIQVAEEALGAWSDVSNITFTRVSGSGPGSQFSDAGTIRFGNFDIPNTAGAAHAYLPFGNRGANSSQGDVWINVAYNYEENPVPYEYGVQTMTHEIGHAIGFSHPGDYNAGQGNPSYDDADFIEDTRMYTVMSYWDETETGADFDGQSAPGLLMIDIAAAQRLYGVNVNYNTGDNTFGFGNDTGRYWNGATAEQPPIFCAWDAGGVDTFDFSGYAVKQTIDLRNGAFSDVGGYKENVSIAVQVKVNDIVINYIENAIGGSFKDTIIGNNANNSIEGRDGDDLIGGNKGNDQVLGDAGNDTIGGGKGNDTLIGGLGADSMAGNKNNDLFLFQQLADSTVGFEDRITNGLDRLDTIDVSAIDADTTTGGNQAFHLGGATFDNEAGEFIRFYHAGSNTTFFQGDVDGDGDADFSLAVTGNYATYLSFAL